MSTHICRDFLSTGNPLSGMYVPNLVLYYMAMFMRVTLGYTVIGQTNFNIDGATLRLGAGVGGTLNQGGADIYAFQPVGYTVSAADIGRILVLKSPSYPMQNSGLFRITSIDLVNNWFYIDYRSGDVPPPETGMGWGIYEHESVYMASLNSTGNGIANTYTGQGAATQSRLILQSPHSTAYQVRLCVENSTDRDSSGPVAVENSIAPGFGGNSAGDFQPGGQHLHGALFFNKRNSNLKGTVVGFHGNAPGNNNQSRIYLWGDDVTGTVAGVQRSVTVSSCDTWTAFGIPEDEELPLPPKNAQRLFVMGAAGTTNGGINGIYWYSNTINDSLRMGMGFGLSNQPISCIFSIYTPLAAVTWNNGRPARNTLAAGDNPYLNATELLSVDLIVGTHDNHNQAGFTNPEVLVLEGRRIGRAPFARMGRSNYGYFQIAPSLDGNTWLHTADGIYLPWKGAILP